MASSQVSLAQVARRRRAPSRDRRARCARCGRSSSPPQQPAARAATRTPGKARADIRTRYVTLAGRRLLLRLRGAQRVWTASRRVSTRSPSELRAALALSSAMSSSDLVLLQRVLQRCLRGLRLRLGASDCQLAPDARGAGARRLSGRGGCIAAGSLEISRSAPSPRHGASRGPRSPTARQAPEARLAPRSAGRVDRDRDTRQGLSPVARAANVTIRPSSAGSSSPARDLCWSRASSATLTVHQYCISCLRKWAKQSRRRHAVTPTTVNCTSTSAG